MGKFIQPFACPICDEFIEGKTKEDHRKECKGPPEPVPVKQPDPIPAPIAEPTGDSEPLSQVERNRRYKQKNKDAYNKYMREYMRRKREEAKELN